VDGCSKSARVRDSSIHALWFEIRGEIPMKYVPKAYLEGQVQNINDVLQTNQRNKFFLQQAYGGFQLQQVASVGSSHGVISISNGYVSKREMYNYLTAFLTGMSMLRNNVVTI
jgi:hypothetical protein